MPRHKRRPREQKEVVIDCRPPPGTVLYIPDLYTRLIPVDADGEPLKRRFEFIVEPTNVPQAARKSPA